MKSKILILCLVILSSGLYAQKHELTIEVNDVRTSKGNIIVLIYDNAKLFPKDGKAMLQVTVKAEKSKTLAKVDLPKGTYALVLYHDINSNGICDTNFIGYPTEPFAFSNNMKPKTSAPSFSSTSITLEKDSKISINLIH